LRPSGRRKTAIVNDGGQLSSELAELRQMLAGAGVPAEVLSALENSADPDQVIDQLVASGVLPGPEDALADLIAHWMPLLQRGVDPLSAEIAGLEFLAAIRATSGDPEQIPAVLTTMVPQVEAHGGAAALAMLRVLAAMGPAEVRPAAMQAADRLVAAGLKDRPWAKELGAPQVGICFGYTDDVGAQEAIAVAFRYGKREHALVALIDHGLGGGIKDCWPTDEPYVVRDGYQQVAQQLMLPYHDYDPTEARAILQRAVERPACPVEPDQVEDVDLYLDLLRQRVALLPTDGVAAAPRTPAGRRDARRSSTGTTVHRVKIALRGSKPPIWRRLDIPSGITLQKLHLVIQAAFGWENYHMWVFEAGFGRYGVPDRELGHQSAALKKLKDIAPRPGDRLSYTYDFGDDWEHDLIVEDVLPAEQGVAYPRCITGRRAAPPEDCGGIWGYEELIAVLADAAHDEHAERLDWLGLTSPTEFDPAHFDKDEINEALADLAMARTTP
jgi:hypothetical protein